MADSGLFVETLDQELSGNFDEDFFVLPYEQTRGRPWAADLEQNGYVNNMISFPTKHKGKQYEADLFRKSFRKQNNNTKLLFLQNQHVRRSQNPEKIL